MHVDQDSVSLQPHDALFRAVFRAPELAAELLRNSVPRDLAAAVDWSSLVFVPGSFVDPDLRCHHADLLFTGQIGARQALLYLLLEHKADDDRFTAFQLLRYVVRIWERCRAETPQARTLPPVLPFVLHHGTSPWRAPHSLRDLIDLDGVPESLVALQPQCTFDLEDLADAGRTDLRSGPYGPFCMLTLLHLQQLRSIAATSRLLRSWTDLFRLVAEDARAEQRLLQLVSYVAAVSDDDPDAIARAYAGIHRKTKEQFMPLADKLQQRGLTKGLSQGLSQGRAEGLRNALRIQLESRFAPVPAAMLMRLDAADPTTLERWLRRVLVAGSLAEVLD